MLDALENNPKRNNIFAANMISTENVEKNVK